MSAQYLISLDVGSTFIKGCLIHKTSEESQTVDATITMPTLMIEQSLAGAISFLSSKIPQTADQSFELVLVGHPPDSPVFAKAAKVSRLSHEEALVAAVKRLSSNATIVVIDIGSHRTLIGLGKYGKTSIETFNYGVGENAWNFLSQNTDTEELQSWMASPVEEHQIEDYLANKSVYPQVIPMSADELLIEQSLAKLILQKIARELPFPWGEIQTLVIDGSVLTQSPTPGIGAAIILDGLQPVGTVRLVSDSSMMLMALGGAFVHWSAENYRVGRTLLHPFLQSVGTIVCPQTVTSAKQGAKITLDTGLDEPQTLSVKPEEIIQIPLAETEPANVILSKNNHFNLDSTPTDAIQAAGGVAGLIIDGRARPISLDPRLEIRRGQLTMWDKQLNLHHQAGLINPGGGANA